jgi:hypothetical protein
MKYENGNLYTCNHCKNKFKSLYGHWCSEVGSSYQFEARGAAQEPEKASDQVER